MTVQVSSIAILLAMAAWTPRSSTAQAPNWTEQALSQQPAPRTSHAMAYDPARGRTVLFGGYTGSPQTFFADTWEWDGASWQQIATSAHPSARHGHAMAFDPISQRIILFGGRHGTTHLGDTWSWDGQSWSQLTTSSAPTARQRSSIAATPNQAGLVLFGGSDPQPLNDTWLWNGLDWTPAQPTSSPPPRRGHAMALDHLSQSTLLFGGVSSGTVLGDFWKWDGTNWTPASATTLPPPRTGTCMATDPTAGKTLLFGGADAATQFATYLQDTWQWDGQAWTPLAQPQSPAGRAWPSLAWHEAANDFVLFGGYRIPPDTYFDDTWTIEGGLQATASTYGSGCGTPALHMQPDPMARPIIGSVSRATIVDGPTLVAAVSMGFRNDTFLGAPLPVSLSVLGMTGCHLWHSGDVLGLVASPLTTNSLLFSFLIPGDPTLTGNHVFLQAYAFAPGANALQIVTSNALDWRLGTH